jgi:peptide/nickel transport system substrate-binding protein
VAGKPVARRLAEFVPLAGMAALALSIAAFAAQRAAGRPTLVIDNSFLVDSTDPHHAFDPTPIIVDRAIYDTLFTFAELDLTRPIGLLVRSWRTADARTFTFRLRTDVRFADGAPLTSADVVFSLRRLINLKGNPSFLLDGVTVAARGRYTVVMKTSTPKPELPTILASTATSIVNSALVKAHGGRDGRDAATKDTAEGWLNSSASAGAGSGPYTLQSYARTSQIVLSPNPRYWGRKKPAFGRVVVRNMTAPTQLLNIQRGSHQVALDLSPRQAQTLRGNGRVRVSSLAGSQVMYLFTNNDPQVSAVTSNRQFQAALRDALDYAGLRALAGPGTSQAPGMITSNVLGALPQRDAARQNLARAKAELAASGVGDSPLTFEYPSDLTTGGVSYETIAQKLQATLQAAGFHISLAGSPATIFQPRFRAGRIAFGLWLYGWTYPDPADYLVLTPGGLIAQHVGWSRGGDPATERLVAQARVATTPSARASLYRQIQRAMNKRSPFFPLLQPALALVATSDLKSAGYSAMYGLDITQASPRDS